MEKHHRDCDCRDCQIDKMESPMIEEKIADICNTDGSKGYVHVGNVWLENELRKLVKLVHEES